MATQAQRSTAVIFGPNRSRAPADSRVRSLIWAKVDQITAQVRRGELGPGAAAAGH